MFLEPPKKAAYIIRQKMPPKKTKVKNGTKKQKINHLRSDWFSAFIRTTEQELNWQLLFFSINGILLTSSVIDSHIEKLRK